MYVIIRTRKTIVQTGLSVLDGSSAIPTPDTSQALIEFGMTKQKFHSVIDPAARK